MGRVRERWGRRPGGVGAAAPQGRSDRHRRGHARGGGGDRAPPLTRRARAFWAMGATATNALLLRACMVRGVCGDVGTWESVGMGLQSRTPIVSRGCSAARSSSLAQSPLPVPSPSRASRVNQDQGPAAPRPNSSDSSSLDQRPAAASMSKRPTDHLEPLAKRRSDRQLTKDDASDEEDEEVCCGRGLGSRSAGL